MIFTTKKKDSPEEMSRKERRRANLWVRYFAIIPRRVSEDKIAWLRFLEYRDTGVRGSYVSFDYNIGSDVTYHYAIYEYRIPGSSVCCNTDGDYRETRPGEFSE